jgi:hypothetical protein
MADVDPAIANPTPVQVSTSEEIIKKRFFSPDKYISTFNPLKLGSYGSGSAGIGNDPAMTGPFYVFITKPDLNVLSEPSKKYLKIGSPVAPEILANLLTNGGSSGFIKLLTNFAESFSTQDIVLDTLTVGEGWTGSKLTMPKHTLNSRQNGSVQIEYKEWSGLPVTLVHKLWIDYIEAVSLGYVFPKGSVSTNEGYQTAYVQARILDYASAMYCFQLLPDGKTIEFGTKYTGIFPTAVPYSPWSGKIGPSEIIKVTIPYAYSYMEPMDNLIFYEFDMSAKNTGVSIMKKLTDSERLVYQLVFTEGLIREPFDAPPIKPPKYEAVPLDHSV